MEPIETFTHNGYTVEIFPDTDAESPRECCNQGTFWTMERRSISPDAMEVPGNVFESVSRLFGGIATAESNAKALDRETVWIPVWKYEHSGVVYAAAPENPFTCPWDSGQVGIIFAKRENIRAEYGVKRITPKIRETVLKNLKQEVESYSKWANGEFVGYVVKDSDGEEVDSCWGIDDIEYAREEAKAACQ